MRKLSEEERKTFKARRKGGAYKKAAVEFFESKDEDRLFDEKDFPDVSMSTVLSGFRRAIDNDKQLKGKIKPHGFKQGDKDSIVLMRTEPEKQVKS